MKRFFLFVLFIGCHQLLFSQTIQTLDSGYLRISYEAKMATDSSNMQFTYKDLFFLDIGTKYSNFYSRYKQVGDSILSEQLKQQINFQTDVLKADMRNIPSGSSSIIIRSITKNLFTVCDQIGLVNYKYMDSLKTPSWKIFEDTVSILGYMCNKATTKFRGRNYIAFFCSDIPISVGPYKFFGLPGAILKINDEKNEFSFSAMSIEKLNCPILIKATKFQLTNRKEFRKLKLAMLDNPEAVLSSQGMTFHTKSLEGGPIITETRKIRPNLLEIE